MWYTEFPLTDVTETFVLLSLSEAQLSAKQSELDLVTAELEKAHATIHGLEKTLQRARAENSSGAIVYAMSL